MVRESKITENIVVFSVLCSIVAYFACLQFINPVLYGGDGYFNIVLTNLIKNNGILHQFPWTQYSVFKDFFSDNNLLFHFFTLPFLYLTNDLLLAAKLSVIFFNALFFVAYLYILKKYLPGYLVAIFLLLPLFSFAISQYFLFLRSILFMHILFILFIQFLINKKWKLLLIISLCFPLVHLSWPLLIIFSLACETVRYCLRKEFFFKNIYIVLKTYKY